MPNKPKFPSPRFGRRIADALSPRLSVPRVVPPWITVQDVECLREAFALFDPDKKETLSHEKLGKVKLKLQILILLNTDLMIGHFIYLEFLIFTFNRFYENMDFDRQKKSFPQ